MVQVGQKAPEFALEGVLDNEFVDVKLSDYAGKWVVLFFYPLDFTFVCPTEIRGFSSRVAEFDALGAKVIGCSVDSKFSHLAWTERDFGKLDFPLLSDMKRSWTPTACCSRTRASRCAGRSSSIRTACCATRACTTTTSAATPKRPFACCRRCRPASSARSTGVRARKRSGSPGGRAASGGHQGSSLTRRPAATPASAVGERRRVVRSLRPAGTMLTREKGVGWPPSTPGSTRRHCWT